VRSSKYNPCDIIPVNPKDRRINHQVVTKAQIALFNWYKYLIRAKIRKFDVQTQRRCLAINWVPAYARDLRIGDKILCDRVIFTITYFSSKEQSIFFEMHSERRTETLEYSPNHIVYKAEFNG
jgi:hypothetical protein